MRELVKLYIETEAKKVPAEDRLFMIKILEGEQDFDYTLKSGAWIHGTNFSPTTSVCDLESKSMCIIGAIVVAKLLPTATTTAVNSASHDYAMKTGLIYSNLDYIIEVGAVPEFIKELRRLEVEE